MAIFNGKISRRGSAPKVISNELPPDIKRDSAGNFYRLDDKGEWVKLKMKKESFNEFFGIDSEDTK